MRVFLSGIFHMYSLLCCLNQVLQSTFYLIAPILSVFDLSFLTPRPKSTYTGGCPPPFSDCFSHTVVHCLPITAWRFSWEFPFIDYKPILTFLIYMVLLEVLGHYCRGLYNVFFFSCSQTSAFRRMSSRKWSMLCHVNCRKHTWLCCSLWRIQNDHLMS